ncbi:MAG: NAD-dependent epimerase/dehydratase family protein [Thermoanaerobaculia bacterium]
MKILIAGGTGVIGAGLIPELLRRGHSVRVLSRGAVRDAGAFPDGIEARAGDVTRPETLRGAVDGCDAVVHITGIVDERPPEVTFESVNVRGAANVLAEASRAGAPRFLYISSLGADRGTSAYHRSKRAAEALVRDYAGPWLILRLGNVFGPGDEVLSQLVRMARSLPAIPLIGDGSQRFQPLWYEDAGAAIAAAVERNDLDGVALDLASGETTTMREVVRRIARITHRRVAAVPVPAAAAAAAIGLTGALGVSFPLTESTLTMLLEENRIPEGKPNALTGVLGVEPAPLDRALERLVTLLPESGAEDGVGCLERKRYWADIHGAVLSAEELMNDFRRNFRKVMPVEFAVEGEEGELVEGATVTASLPVRGHIQVRVEESGPRSVTLATVEGHPLAGIVRFRAEPAGEVLRVAVEVEARAASWWDVLTMKFGGSMAQRWNWRELVRRMVVRSGGTAPEGVQTVEETLGGSEAERTETEARRLIDARRRAEAERLTREERGR